ncbi:MAG: mechanosensitive ion channel family protein, partial [Caldimonas sp.]
EMGQPPSVQTADPAMWVRSRQFTGRIVTVSNARIFSEPVFNYTRDFPFLWEEMTIPVTYKDDRRRVEQILLEAARRHAQDPAAMAADAKADLEKRFSIESFDLEPRVYLRITDNWLELTVRFVVGTHRIRAAKDAMSRFIIDELDAAGIGIASATYEIVGLPAFEMRSSGSDTDRIPADRGPTEAARARAPVDNPRL